MKLDFSTGQNTIKHGTGADMNKQIFLVGFRAVGKTTVGKELARRLGWRFVDMDESIIQRYGCSIREIVEKHGWDGFRKTENEVLQDLADDDKCVVATGGGAILHQKTWERIRPSAGVIWLSASLATHAARLGKDAATADNRPSLTGAGIIDEIAPILAERTPLYKKTAHLEIATDSGSVEGVLEEIMKFCKVDPIL